MTCPSPFADWIEELAPRASPEAAAAATTARTTPSRARRWPSSSSRPSTARPTCRPPARRSSRTSPARPVRRLDRAARHRERHGRAAAAATTAPNAPNTRGQMAVFLVEDLRAAPLRAVGGQVQLRPAAQEPGVQKLVVVGQAHPRGRAKVGRTPAYGTRLQPTRRAPGVPCRFFSLPSTRSHGFFADLRECERNERAATNAIKGLRREA